jgi:hypothetical protein
MTIDSSVLLHNDCNRLLRRSSRQNLVNEVMYDLFDSQKEKETNHNKNNNIFIELLLSICCFKNN